MRADYEKMARQAGRKPGRMLAALIAFLLILLIVAVMILRAAFSGSMGFSGGEPEEKYKVAMIVKSTKSAFFQSVFAGAGVAATEYNIELTTEGPETEEDYEMQNALIDQAVKNGADAIVISAVDFEENKAAVDRAAGKGLPVVVIDSDVNSSLVSCRIGTDNLEAGRMAAEAVLAQTEGELIVGIVNFDENTANGQEREAGFRQAMEESGRVEDMTTINVLSTTEDAREGTRGLIGATPGLDVIVTFNEWTSLGVGWAIRDEGKKDDIMVTAFDSNVISVGMLETGEVDALIVQNPYAMGYLGVESAYRLLAGKEPAAKRVDTATTLVTRENMYRPEYQKILFRYE